MPQQTHTSHDIWPKTLQGVAENPTGSGQNPYREWPKTLQGLGALKPTGSGPSTLTHGVPGTPHSASSPQTPHYSICPKAYPPSSPKAYTPSSPKAYTPSSPKAQSKAYPPYI